MVTITGLRSSLAGAVGFGALACGERGVRFVTITSTSSRTGFFFRGGSRHSGKRQGRLDYQKRASGGPEAGGRLTMAEWLARAMRNQSAME